VHGIARLIDEYDIDGVYLDTTGSIRRCWNARHGCGYTTSEGKRLRTSPVFGIRECMKRIYTAVKTRKPDGIVDLHTGGGVSIPSITWATSYYYGEQYAYLKKGTTLRNVFDLPEFRTELMGHPFGVPADFLFPYSKWMTERQTLSVTLLHDVLVRPHESTPAIELTSQLGRVADAFDREHADWLPYWRNGDYVSASPHGTDDSPGVFVSLYRHSANGVLAVVSNLGPPAEVVEVRFDVTRLGFESGRLVATDALTDAAFDIKDGRVTLPAMSQLDWRMIRLTPATSTTGRNE
jgi:hypothetical protein